MPGNTFLPAASTGLPRDSVANVTAVVTLNKADLTDHVGHVPDSLLYECRSRPTPCPRSKISDRRRTQIRGSMTVTIALVLQRALAGPGERDVCPSCLVSRKPMASSIGHEGITRRCLRARPIGIAGR